MREVVEKLKDADFQMRVYGYCMIKDGRLLSPKEAMKQKISLTKTNE